MHRPYASDAEIEAIAAGLERHTLPRPDWTHAAHFAAALWLLRRGEAHRTPALIRAYNESVGVMNTPTAGYHETITQASLRGAAAALALWPADAPLHVVHADLMSTELGGSKWPLAYWSAELLFSPGARAAWMEPDLAPLPYGEVSLSPD